MRKRRNRCHTHLCGSCLFGPYIFWPLSVLIGRYIFYPLSVLIGPYIFWLLCVHRSEWGRYCTCKNHGDGSSLPPVCKKELASYCFQSIQTFRCRVKFPLKADLGCSFVFLMVKLVLDLYIGDISDQ